MVARLGSTHARLGEYETALELLRRAAQLAEAAPPSVGPDAWLLRDAAIFSHLRTAESLIALGRRPEARYELARVLELADCGECATTSREIETSRTRAIELLELLDRGTVPAAPQAASH